MESGVSEQCSASFNEREIEREREDGGGGGDDGDDDAGVPAAWTVRAQPATGL